MEEKVDYQKIVRDFQAREDNMHCADCASTETRWASITLGVFICTNCSGVHRHLGVHISKIRSIELDSWDKRSAERLVELGGNAKTNAYWGCNMLPFEKPLETDLAPFRQFFISRKYVEKQFIAQNEENLQTRVFDPEMINRKGWLAKQGGSRKTWHRRWCILYPDRLAYFKHENDSYPAGFIELTDRIQIEFINALPDGTGTLADGVSTVSRQGGSSSASKSAALFSNLANRKFLFTIRTSDRDFVLCAENEMEMCEWILCLRAAVYLNKLTLGGSGTKSGGCISLVCPLPPSPVPSSPQSEETQTALSSRVVEKKGWLKKTGGKIQTLKRRYFVLKGNILSYYATDKEAEALGEIPLKGARIEDNPKMRKKGHYPITINATNGRRYFIIAESERDMQEWSNAIKQVVGLISDSFVLKNNAELPGMHARMSSLPPAGILPPNFNDDGVKRPKSMSDISRSDDSDAGSPVSLPVSVSPSPAPETPVSTEDTPIPTQETPTPKTDTPVPPPDTANESPVPESLSVEPTKLDRDASPSSLDEESLPVSQVASGLPNGKEALELKEETSPEELPNEQYIELHPTSEVERDHCPVANSSILVLVPEPDTAILSPTDDIELSPQSEKELESVDAPHTAVLVQEFETVEQPSPTTATPTTFTTSSTTSKEQQTSAVALEPNPNPNPNPSSPKDSSTKDLLAAISGQLRSQQKRKLSPEEKELMQEELDLLRMERELIEQGALHYTESLFVSRGQITGLPDPSTIVKPKTPDPPAQTASTAPNLHVGRPKQLKRIAFDDDEDDIIRESESQHASLPRAGVSSDAEPIQETPAPTDSDQSTGITEQDVIQLVLSKFDEKIKETEWQLSDDDPEGFVGLYPEKLPRKQQQQQQQQLQQQLPSSPASRDARQQLASAVASALLNLSDPDFGEDDAELLELQNQPPPLRERQMSLLPSRVDDGVRERRKTALALAAARKGSVVAPRPR